MLINLNECLNAQAEVEIDAHFQLHPLEVASSCKIQFRRFDIFSKLLGGGHIIFSVFSCHLGNFPYTSCADFYFYLMYSHNIMLASVK